MNVWQSATRLRCRFVWPAGSWCDLRPALWPSRRVGIGKAPHGETVPYSPSYAQYIIAATLDCIRRAPPRTHVFCHPSPPLRCRPSRNVCQYSSWRQAHCILLAPIAFGNDGCPAGWPQWATSAGEHRAFGIVLRYVDGGVRYRRLASIAAFDGHLMSWPSADACLPV
jgi:hypothetical protein